VVHREEEERKRALRDARAAAMPDGLRRGLLVALSAGGVCVAAGLWFAGHWYLALRALALDVVLALAILLLG
jgi:hypothetical protein